MKTPNSQLQEVDAELYDAFDLRALYEVVRRKVWMIVACAFAATALAAVYAATLPDVFEVTATIQVEQEIPSVVGITDVTKEDFRQPEDLKTIEQQLIAPTLIWRVIRANKLDEAPGFFKPGLLSRMSGRPLSETNMIDALSGNFVVKLRKGTRLIDITAKHGDAKMAQTLVRSLIDEYVNQNFEWRANPSKDADKFLIEEAERLKQTAEKAGQALNDYREKNHAVSLDEKQNIVVERLKDLNLRVAQAQNDTATLESDLAQLEKVGRQPEKLLAIGSIANSPSVLDAQRGAAAKEGAFVVIRQRYGPENPAYAQAERELQQVRAALDAAVLNAADSLRAKYEAAKFTQQAAEKRLQEQEQLALDLNRKATEYSALSREVEADRVLFDSVVKRIKEMSVIQNINKIYLRVVDPPRLPDLPGLRRKLLTVILGTFGGAFIGLAGVVGLAIARPLVLTVDHAARLLGLPALGAIPRIPRLKGDASQFPGIAEPRSQAAEAFRFLAAATSTVPDASGRGSVLLSGATQTDGNTVCAAGYAVALAQSGVRTLLVDADLRNPTIGRLFSIPKDAPGLADCLAGRNTLESSVLATKVDNLFILVAGAAPSEISRLFSGPAFHDLIGKAVEDFGRVVIDSAPVTMASETLLIARHVSAACIVLRCGQTSTSAASRATQLFQDVGCLPVGLILNRVPRRLMP